MKTIFAFAIALVLGITACTEKTPPVPAAVTPTNLTLVAVVNPDNSGNVSFTATATNAAAFVFDFGTGSTQTLAAGNTTYKYSTSGTYTVTVTAKSSTGQSVSKSILVNVTVTLSLVWFDEFNTDGLPDASKWGYDLGAGGWGNNELQYYTSRPENATVTGGVLKITAKAESYLGSSYTSARLLSRGKYSFKYGRVEARAKLPAGAGTWPAIWMLGDNFSAAGWPACGEIDIMEHVGSQLNKIFGTLHHPGHSGGNADGGSVNISNATTEFHKYSLEWTSTSIKFLVDDVLFYTFANTGSLPFNQNFFLILNVAMGGNFGGAIDPAFTSASMEIDYIRVYN